MIKRFWVPFGIAILVICLIEASIYVLYKPSFWDKTTWLLHDPYRGEPFDRLVVYEKLQQLLDEKPDIISVGDSSGFFSIHPKIVNRYLRGLKYVSLSTGANQGFVGYQGIAEFMLKRQPSIKYVVLNMYPALLPSKELFRKADLAPIEYDDLASIKAWLTPPSASLSPYAKSWFFYHTRYDKEALLSSHKVYLELHHTIKQTLGWVPEHDIPFDRVLALTPFYADKEKKADTLFGLNERSAIQTTLTEFANLCRAHHVKLMIMFNPMPWQTIFTSHDLFVAERRLVEFQHHHPDVIFLTDRLITPWDPAKFGMFNHVSRAYVHESSARMGKAIEKAIYYPATLPRFRIQWQPQPFPATTEITAIGKANAEQKQAALAYYLYTAMTKKSDWQRLSNRVSLLLKKDQAFKWMIEEMHARNALLNKKGMNLIYDTSQLDADIVTFKGGYYCGNNKNVQWIRLSGVMQFGFNLGTQMVLEPVQWPITSNIIIPVIYEGKSYKFDGYCAVQV